MGGADEPEDPARGRRRGVPGRHGARTGARRARTDHRFPSCPIGSVGAYRLSVWTDPDSTDDGSPGGRFWVTLQSNRDVRDAPADTKVVVTIRPIDRAGEPRTATAHPVGGDVSNQLAELVMDHEGRFAVGVAVTGALGEVAVEAEVAATYDSAPATRPDCRLPPAVRADWIPLDQAPAASAQAFAAAGLPLAGREPPLTGRFVRRRDDGWILGPVDARPCASGGGLMSTESRVNVVNAAVGLCFVALGVLLLLEAGGVMSMREIIRLWPVALIIVGGAVAVQAFVGGSERCRGSIGGLVWLVLLGVLFSHVYDRRASGATEAGALSSLPCSAVHGRRRRTAPSPAAGSRACCGSHLDLRQALLVPGQTAVVDVFTVFGGTEIRVPEGWRVELQTTAIMGGVNDERPRRNAVQTTAAAPPGGTTAAAGIQPARHGL